MPQRSEAVRRDNRDSPELLLSYLQYALRDVRSLSERSGRHLELAIAALAEDTRLAASSDMPCAIRQRS